MALVIESSDAGTASLEELLDYVRRYVDPDDVDSLRSCAPILAKLAADRSFFARTLVGQLKRLARFQDSNPYVPTSFLLGRGERYAVRANLWRPVKSTDDPHRVSKLYTYGTAHDHDFSLLTAGYWGPGYQTVTSTYDHRKITGSPGERVELSPLEHEALSTGKLMLYVASRDVHVQLPPDDFSISLNVITWPKNPLPQYLFDFSTGTLVSSLKNGYSNIISVFDIAAMIGDGATHGLLEEIQAGHDSPSVRAAAGAAREEIEARALTAAEAIPGK